MDRYNGRVTVEEMLDSIFNRTPASGTQAYDCSSTPPEYEQEGEGARLGIYTKNYMLMEQAMKHPSKADSLLKSELLFVRCSFCHKTRELAAARMHYVCC
ncbi:hypothetical protein OSTOST_00934, partial [Ostertagia ostertagi]